jgi:hypothetical protein
MVYRRLSIISAFVAGLVSFAQAAETPSGTAMNAESNTSAPATHAPAPAVHSMENKPAAHRSTSGRVTGTVASIDVAKKEIEVKTDAGKIERFTLSKETQIMKAGQPITADKITKGEKVENLRYDSASRRVRRLTLGA